MESSEGKPTPKMIRFPAMNKKKTCDVSRATNRKWSKPLQATQSISFLKKKTTKKKTGRQQIPLKRWITIFFSLKAKGATYSALEDLQRPCHVLIGSEVCINLCVFALGVWTADE